MAKRMTVSICMKLTPEDHRTLEQASELVSQSMSEIVRQLIRCYLAPQLREGRVFPGRGCSQPVNADLFTDSVGTPPGGAPQ